jgi:hypothetical protein
VAVVVPAGRVGEGGAPASTVDDDADDCCCCEGGGIGVLLPVAEVALEVDVDEGMGVEVVGIGAHMY